MEVNVRPPAPFLGRAPRNGLMALKAFTYPLPETRFIHAGGTVYKLKMRYSHHIREDLGINREQVGQELEDSIRAVLGNLDNLQPFTTAHFTIFPFKEESPFTDCGLAEELRGEAVATVARGTKEKETEGSQLQPNRKRMRSAIDINNKENRNDSNTASRKKRKKQVKRPDQVDIARGKQASSGNSGKPPDAAVFSSDVGVKEQTNLHQRPKPGSPETVAGGILRFLSSAFIPFHLIFGTKRPQ